MKKKIIGLLLTVVMITSSGAPLGVFANNAAFPTIDYVINDNFDSYAATTLAQPDANAILLTGANWKTKTDNANGKWAIEVDASNSENKYLRIASNDNSTTSAKTFTVDNNWSLDRSDISTYTMEFDIAFNSTANTASYAQIRYNGFTSATTNASKDIYIYRTGENEIKITGPGFYGGSKISTDPTAFHNIRLEVAGSETTPVLKTYFDDTLVGTENMTSAFYGARFFTMFASTGKNTTGVDFDVDNAKIYKGKKPLVTDVFPSDESVDLTTDVVPTVTFDTDIYPGSLNSDNIVLINKKTNNPVVYTGAYDSETRTWSMVGAKLAHGTTYEVNITDSVVSNEGVNATPAVYKFTTAASSGDVLPSNYRFKKTFNDQSAGDTSLSGWTNSAWDVFVKENNDNIFAQLTANTTGTNASIYTTCTKTTNRYSTFGMKFRANDLNSTANDMTNSLMLRLWDTTGNQYIQMVINSNDSNGINQIYTIGGSNSCRASTDIVKDVWYELTILADASEKTYNIYINGSSIIENAEMRTRTSQSNDFTGINKIELLSHTTGTPDYYIDDVFVVDGTDRVWMGDRPNFVLPTGVSDPGQLAKGDAMTVTWDILNGIPKGMLLL